jgi:hypothetical protein
MFSHNPCAITIAGELQQQEPFGARERHIVACALKESAAIEEDGYRGSTWPL